MNRVIVIVMAILAIATGAQAANHIYGDVGSSLENAGYKLFVSDKILDTVDKLDGSNGTDANYCAGANENTSKLIGDISTVRSDNRLSIDEKTKTSYAVACSTYYSVVKRLKTADDIRRLWLLFADSATDDYAVETTTDKGETEDASVLIEIKRLGIVSKYIEFFTKNKDWRLTDYTFLSQAFKLRKGKTLSPAFSQFVASLLTGNEENAFQVVKSIDLDNLGNRFVAPCTNDGMKMKKGTAGPGVK